MKKFAIVSAFIFFAWFGFQYANAEVVQTEQKIKCIPTYTNPCTNEGFNLGAEVLGNNNSGGISNKNNTDPSNVSGAIDTLGQITSPLKLNSSGPGVKALQEILIAQGLLTGTADGKFGLKTQNAVMALQKAKGLKADGVFGAQAFSSINSSTTNNTNTSSSTTSSSSTSSSSNTNKCTLSSKPSITVLSPNASGSYVGGKQMTVKWDSCNIPKNLDHNVSILLRIYDSNGRQVANTVLNSYTPNYDGKETVTLPKTLPSTPAGLSFGKNFKISVTAVGYKDATGEDYSDNFFTITDPNPKKSQTTSSNTNSTTNSSTTNKNNTNTNSNVTIDKNDDKKNEGTKEVKKENNSKLFVSNSCPKIQEEKLYTFFGEIVNKATNTISRASDVWSTMDGVNWKQEAKTTAIGERWELMPVKVGKTVYQFGGKYKPTGGYSDNAIYKSTDMVKWTYVGELPEMSHYYDRSVVYFKNKFWLLQSLNSSLSLRTDPTASTGVWSSADGKKWKMEKTNVEWTGYGSDRAENTKGYYDSNSLGAFVIGNKMFYLIYNGSTTIKIYTTTDGNNWKDEGNLVNSADSKSFNIATNTNPFPIMYQNKVWIISKDKNSNTPMVINSSDGLKWDLVSTKDTNLSVPRYYSSDVAFNGKLWSIGGFSGSDKDDGSVWSSKNGIKWEKMDIKGVTSFPGPADRHLSGAVAIPTGKSIVAGPTDLKVDSFYDTSSYSTDNVKEGVLGVWKLTASPKTNKSATADVVIDSLKFLGTDFKNASGDFSSLASMKNIKVYTGSGRSELVGELSKFSGPFYDDSNYYVYPQSLDLTKPIVLKKDEEVTITVIADFSFTNDLQYFSTYLAGFEFGGLGDPCQIYSGNNSKDFFKSPGISIMKKSAAI